ncbi:MAG: tetratricopeptide repeat protein, partial [Alphaproteobacteria bacterium]
MSQSVPRLSLAARVFPVLAAVFAAALHSMAPTSGATAAPATGLLAAPGEALARAGLRLVVKNSTYGKYLAAGHAESVHDYATAAELIAEVLAERPDDPELLSRGHRLMAMAGRMEDAVRLARHLLEVEPADPEAQVVVAAHEIKMGAHEAAADRLEAIERSGANQLIVPLLRAWALAGADELEDGLDELEALAEEGAFEVFAALHAGLIADYAGDAEAAEEGYSRARGAARGLPLRLVEAYGSYLSRAGRFDEAKAIMTAFLEQQPDDLLLEEARARLAAGRELAPMVSAPSDGVAEVLSSVARRLASEGASAEAMPYARMALDLRPDDPLSQLLLAEILSNLGRTDDALIAFEAVDRSSPYAWTARLNEAQTLETLDRMADAVALLRRMVDERPERSDAAQALGNILRFNERFREAVKAYDVAIDRLDAIEQRHWRLLYARGIALERS